MDLNPQASPGKREGHKNCSDREADKNIHRSKETENQNTDMIYAINTLFHIVISVYFYSQTYYNSRQETILWLMRRLLFLNRAFYILYIPNKEK